MAEQPGDEVVEIKRRGTASSFALPGLAGRWSEGMIGVGLPRRKNSFHAKAHG